MPVAIDEARTTIIAWLNAPSSASTSSYVAASRRAAPIARSIRVAMRTLPRRARRAPLLS
jgi:hypothetical protein